MEKAGESTAAAVQVSNGGYLASLGVFHEIHCLVGQVPL